MGRVLTMTLNPALDLTIRLGAVRLGEVNRAESARLDAAGKGINVARVLAKLGHDVTVTGLLGVATESYFLEAFTEHGLRDAFIRVPGETRINTKLSEPDGRVTDLNGPGPQIPEPAMASLIARLDSILPELDLVVIAGSLPPHVTPEHLAGIVTRVRERGLPVWLDTSGDALVAGVRARPTGIKPNEKELGDCVGQQLEDAEALLQAARQLQGGGIEEVLLSTGAGSVTWLGRHEALRAKPPKVQVVSTVGAGDTLLAGTVHGLLSGWPRERSLRFATALASESVRHIGVGEPDAPDFDALQSTTAIESLTLDPLPGRMHQ